MTLKSLLALALLSGAVVLTGWGTIGFAGLTVGFTDPGDDPSKEKPALAPPVVTGAIEPAPAAPEPPAADQDRDLNALLFSPQFVVPPPVPTSRPLASEPPAAGALAPETTEPAATVPEPPTPPRRRSDTGTAKAPKSAATRAQRPPRDTFQGPFTLSHVARIKQRLNLTADQEEHWRPVEEALRRIAARQTRGGSILLSATESQELYWAAGPLIMSLRPDQREEARKLARSMGLETVASLI